MFKSHKEKIAYKQGIKKGRAGGRVWKGRDDPPYIKSTSNFNNAVNCSSSSVSDIQSMIAQKRKASVERRKKEEIKHSSSKGFSNKTKKGNKPVYDYSKDFDFDKKGRIKGSYTSDGFFEPD